MGWRKWALARRVALVGLCVLVIGVAAAGASPNDRTAEQTQALADSPDQPRVCVVMFYSPTCPHCQNVKDFLEENGDQYRFKVVGYPASQHPDRFRTYLDAYDVPRGQRLKVPTVFVGDEYAVGDQPSIELIQQAFDQSGTVACPSLERTETATETEPATSEPELTATATTEAPEGMGTATTDGSPPITTAEETTVASATTDGGDTLTVPYLAGLAVGDAVNPCALAVLVVLLTTVLSRYPDRKAKVLQAGLAFAFGVLATYGTVGLLLVGGLKSAANVTMLQMSFLRPLFGGFAILIGLFNIKDGLDYGAGGFVLEVPQSWRPRMQRYLTRPLWSRRSVILGGMLAGIGVSLFLLPCTAGPYLVAGGLLAGLPWIEAVPLLVAYNLLFVAPMIGITLAVYGGYTTADAVGSWREDHLEELHLAAGLILVALGGLLVAGLI